MYTLGRISDYVYTGMNIRLCIHLDEYQIMYALG